MCLEMDRSMGSTKLGATHWAIESELVSLCISGKMPDACAVNR